MADDFKQTFSKIPGKNMDEQAVVFRASFLFMLILICSSISRIKSSFALL